MQNAEGRGAACTGLRDTQERGDSKSPQSPHLVPALCRDPRRPQSLQTGHKLFLVHPRGRGISSEQGFPQVNYGVQHPAVCPSR